MNPLAALIRYPLWTLPPPELVQEWVSSGQLVRVGLGETLFQEGSKGDWAYLLIEGRIRVLRRDADSKESTLGSLQPGQFFGEYALVKPGLNTATCRAAADSVVVQLPLSAIEKWLNSTPLVARRLKNWLQLHQLLQQLRGQSHRGFMSDASALAMHPHLIPLEVGVARTLQAPGLCDDWWFFIEEGEVRLGIGPHAELLGKGDSFAASALMGDTNHPCAVTLAPTRILGLPRPFFEQPKQMSGKSGEQSYKANFLQAPSRVRWIGQKEASDCGPAALAMLAYYFDIPIGLEAIRARSPVTDRGLLAVDLLEVARSISLKGEAVRVQRSQLGYVKVPAIAHLEQGHFVVVFRLDPQGVLLGDPASGLVTVSLQHFLEHYTGCLLLLKPA